MISATPLAIAVLALSTGQAATSQPAPSAAPAVASVDPASVPLTPGEGRQVAEKVAAELLSTFVIPANAKDYAATLRKNAAAGRYDNGTRKELADRMTEDLLAIHKDGHLHVSVRRPEREQRGGRAGPPKGLPPMIQSAKWLAPGIAYIRPTAFMSTDEEVADFRKFMADHKDAKTMIFDMRNHHGGRLGEMDVIFPYLFAAKTPLVKMEMARSIYDEHGSPFGDAPSLEFAKGDARVTATHYALPGEATPLRDARIILLTSNATASAGEHFSLAMKSSGRATLIGEATAGANHFGGPAPVTDHFEVWMPIGRTYDIKTGQDWEGAGVQPDVAVDPKQALVVALERAGLSTADAVRIDATEIPAEPVHRDKLRAR
jgi:hypothetical protein